MKQCTIFLFAIIATLAITTSSFAGWLPVTVKGTQFLLSQYDENDPQFTLKHPAGWYGGNVNFRMVIKGCTFNDFKIIMENDAAAPVPTPGCGFSVNFTPGPGVGYVFSATMSAYFVTILGQPLQVKYFADVQYGTQTDVNLTLANAVLSQASVLYGRPTVYFVGVPPILIPVPQFSAGAQGRVKITCNSTIGTVNVSGGIVDTVSATSAQGQIGAVYARKRYCPNGKFFYGGVIGTQGALLNIGTLGNIGTIVANNGISSPLKLGLPYACIARIAAGWNGSVGAVKNIAAIYMPFGGNNAVFTAGTSPTAALPPVPPLFMGNVRALNIGNKGPTTGTSVVSRDRTKVGGTGKAAAVGNVYTSLGVFPLNAP